MIILMKYPFPVLVFILGIVLTAGAERMPSFSAEEEAWMAENPVVYFAPDPDYAPMEWVENGEYFGMTADFLALVSERTGLEFKRTETRNWNHVLELLKTGGTDFSSGATPTTQRKEYMLFTEPFIKAEVVILSREGSSFEVELEDIVNHRVGMLSGYAEVDFMQLLFPLFEPILYSEHEKALEDLALGQIDYFICSIPTANYYIEKLKFRNIVVTGDTGFSHNLALGVRKDLPVLRDILQKGLDSISAEEYDEIIGKWAGLDLNRYFVPRSVIRFILSAAVIIALLLLLILMWNRTLVRAVAEKTDALNRELSENRKQAEKLRVSNQEKVILLHEVYHRVNNNMQAIMNLLNLGIGEEHPGQLSPASLLRVNVIARVQALGHTETSLNKLNIHELAEALVADLNSFCPDGCLAGVRLEKTGFWCGIEEAIDVGLLLNEVLLSLSGSFPGKKITAGFFSSEKGDHSIRLIVDAPGCTKEAFEGSLGGISEVIISNIVESLHADVGSGPASGSGFRWVLTWDGGRFN